jgi:hypothetical protein
MSAPRPDPIAWDSYPWSVDRVVVDRLLHGERVRATQAELRCAAEILIAQGHGTGSIASITHRSGTAILAALAPARKDVAA